MTLVISPESPLSRGAAARVGRVAVACLVGVLSGSALLSLRSLAVEDVQRTVANLPRAAHRFGPVSLALPAGWSILDDPDGELDIVDRAVGMIISPFVLGTPADPVSVLAEVERRDAEAVRRHPARSDKTDPGDSDDRGMDGADKAPSVTLEAAGAPAVEGWTAAGQRSLDGLQLYYYAKEAGPSRPGSVVLVRFNHFGEPVSSVAAEIRRVLATLVVERDDGPALPATRTGTTTEGHAPL